MNRWDRYALIDELYSDLGASVDDALEHHKHSQSSAVQARLFAKVARTAREIADLADVEAPEVADPQSNEVTGDG